MDRDKSLRARFHWLFRVVLEGIVSSLSHISIPKAIVSNRYSGFRFQELVSQWSPSRNFTHQYLRDSLLDLKVKLKDHSCVTVVDFGAGDARYYELISEVFEKQKFKYYALEHPDFQFSEQVKKLSNCVCLNVDLNGELPVEIFESDIFLSISVLEHLDLKEKFLINYLPMCKTGSFHLHIVPGFWSLFNYFWHGVGHFLVKDVNKVYRETGGFVQEFCVTWATGIFEIIVHMIFITLPQFTQRLFGINITEGGGRAYLYFLRLSSFLDQILRQPFASFLAIRIEK